MTEPDDQAEAAAGTTSGADGAVHPSRRDVLRWLAGGTAVAAAGAGAWAWADHDGGSGSSPSRSRATPTTTVRPFHSSVPASARALVLIEMAGGNDGLSTMVPPALGRLHDLRPTLVLGEQDTVPFAEGYRLNRALAGLHDGRLACLDGVGVAHPSLSHFDMLARWWGGRPDGGRDDGTGFLGRICDHLGAPDSTVGVSIGVFPSPSARSAHQTMVSVASADPVPRVAGAPASADVAYRRAIRAMGVHAGTGLVPVARSSLDGMLDLDALLSNLPKSSMHEVSDGPGVAFAAQLMLVSQLLQADTGVRVIHLGVEGANFDTHADHRKGHAACLATMAPGLVALRRDLQQAGLSDRVLIATTSEFGRRAAENDGGLDHGTASSALLMGPVTPGMHGDGPALTRLDDNGNLFATVTFDRYLATLATWMDIDPKAVLDGAPTPIPGLLG